MKTYSFYGASDDLFEWSVENSEGLHDRDEIGCFQKKEGINCSVILRSKSEGECRIFGIYGVCGEGVWGFGVAQTEEDKPIPEWSVSIEQAEDPQYSVLLSIDCPDDTKLVVDEEEEG